MSSPVFRTERSIFDQSPLVRLEAPVYVIGTVNMDITGTPEEKLQGGGASPGSITLSPGGTGLNIAENLCLLGRKVSLVTITGDDEYAEIIRHQCIRSGIDMQYSMTDSQGRTSAYLRLNEQGGSLHAAVSDTAVCEGLTVERIRPLLPLLNHGSMVIADANLPEETLAWIGKNVTVPLAAVPVSTAKVLRLKPLLPALTILRASMRETEMLIGFPVLGDGDLGRAADALHRMGVQRVYITLGDRGVWADDRREGGKLLPGAPGPVVNTSGCEDAFMAAAADAYLKGAGTLDGARRALAAAAICAGDTAAVSTRLSQEAIEVKLNFPV